MDDVAHVWRDYGGYRPRRGGGAASGGGASKRLATLIEAESLFNDGTSFVFFLIWKDFVVGKSRNSGEVTRFLVRLSVGGASLGLGIGVFAVAFLAHFNNPMVETSITISTAYFTFWLSESNDIGLHVSGVLATVILGLTLSRYKSYISVASEETLHAFWRVVGWLINTLIFFISGIFVAQKLFSGSDHLSMVDFGWLLVLYVFLHLIRGTTIALLSPFMRRMGYGFELNTGIVLMWGGLRGAVGLALALRFGRITSLNRSKTAYCFTSLGSFCSRLQSAGRLQACFSAAWV